MDKVFKDSEELKILIEKHRWTLYDISSSVEQGVKFEWADLEEQGSAERFVIPGHYIFAPIPKEGQSLRDAYSVTKGLGPSLLIDDRCHERWRSLYVTSKDNTFYWGGREPSTSRIALFSRLSFDDRVDGEENVHAWTPNVAHPNPDFVLGHLLIEKANDTVQPEIVRVVFRHDTFYDVPCSLPREREN